MSRFDADCHVHGPDDVRRAASPRKRHWLRGSYSRLSRGEREFAIVAAFCLAALVVFTALLFLLTP